MSFLPRCTTELAKSYAEKADEWRAKLDELNAETQKHKNAETEKGENSETPRDENADTPKP